MTTGYIEDDHTAVLSPRRSEVIDILDPSLQCNDLGMYPFNAFFATGGLVAEKPVICGGGGDGSGNGKANPDCYVFDQNAWQFLTNLGTQRKEFSSVVLGDELWVSVINPNLNIDSFLTF